MKLIIFLILVLTATPILANVNVCIRVSDEKILESQSNPVSGTMTANAVSAGYAENEVYETIITDEEYLLRTIKEKSEAEIIEDMIELEMKEIAQDALVSKGELRKVGNTITL